MALKKKMDALPVTPVYVGDRAALETNLTILAYDSSGARMDKLSGIDDLSRYQNKSKVSWINISGLKDVEFIKRLGDFYNIHSLSIEDILNTEQQPKVEIFDNYRFLSIKTIQRERKFYHEQGKRKGLFSFWGRKDKREEVEEFLIDQISMIIMGNTLLTFQEIPGDSFDGLRKKLLDGIGDIRKMGADYLAYALIDAVVDEYFVTLNHLEDDIENFEEHAAKTSDYTFIEEIQDTKKYLLQIKRAILPLRDNITTITRRADFFPTDALQPFLHDLNEHLNHAIMSVENHREWLTNIMDVNLSVLSYQMNKVMKVLAIISTLFIPLTFISGVYGMNFEFMPELGHRLGYPIVLCAMGVVAVVMILYFKIRRWF